MDWTWCETPNLIPITGPETSSWGSPVLKNCSQRLTSSPETPNLFPQGGVFHIPASDPSKFPASIVGNPRHPDGVLCCTHLLTTLPGPPALQSGNPSWPTYQPFCTTDAASHTEDRHHPPPNTVLYGLSQFLTPQEFNPDFFFFFMPLSPSRKALPS